MFEKYLGDKFTIYAFDVLHHGNSEHDGEPVTENDLKELVKVFTKQHSITKFSLLGFSLGGRIVLQLTIG